MRFIKIWRQK